MVTLSVLPDSFAICRLDRDAVPLWAAANHFISITCTTDELSIVCHDRNVPNSVKCDRGWRCFRVEGPLDLTLTGILASLTAPLAEAKIALFAVSTYDTDYVLVKEDNLTCAVDVLRRAGYIIQA